MKVADLIAALSALPPDAEVIMPDLAGGGAFGEIYAKAAEMRVRHVTAYELGMMDFDFTPTLDPVEGSVPVALIVPVGFDWDDRILTSGHPQQGQATYSIVPR